MKLNDCIVSILNLRNCSLVSEPLLNKGKIQELNEKIVEFLFEIKFHILSSRFSTKYIVENGVHREPLSRIIVSVSSFKSLQKSKFISFSWNEAMLNLMSSRIMASKLNSNEFGLKWVLLSSDEFCWAQMNSNGLKWVELIWADQIGLK